MWLSLSVSYAFIITNYVSGPARRSAPRLTFEIFSQVQLYLGSITLHHTVVVVLLSSLPYVATMAGEHLRRCDLGDVLSLIELPSDLFSSFHSGMNSLTTFRGLGKKGMIVLQVGSSPLLTLNLVRRLRAHLLHPRHRALRQSAPHSPPMGLLSRRLAPRSTAGSDSSHVPPTSLLRIDRHCGVLHSSQEGG